jgi:glutamyl-tRNA reductase
MVGAYFVTMLNKLIFSRKILLKPLYDSLKSDSADESIHRINELKSLLEKNLEKRYRLRQLRGQEIIDNVVFSQEMNLLTKLAEEYRNELSILSCYTSAEALEVTEMEKLLKYTEATAVVEEFSDALFHTFVDHIIVYGRDYVEFRLRCGLTLKEVI